MSKKGVQNQLENAQIIIKILLKPAFGANLLVALPVGAPVGLLESTFKLSYL